MISWEFFLEVFCKETKSASAYSNNPFIAWLEVLLQKYLVPGTPFPFRLYFTLSWVFDLELLEAPIEGNADLFGSVQWLPWEVDDESQHYL